MRSYTQIRNFVWGTPWAILPSALIQIRQVVLSRLEDGRLDDEEIQSRIEAAQNGRQVTPSQGSVAVIPIHGALIPRADVFTDISGGTSYEMVRDAFQAAMNDPSVSSIVLDIDSPGGSVAMLSETAAMIRDGRASKKVVAVANAMAGSAAYYLASAASEVVATPSGSVGSIGTVAVHESFEKALEMEGIDATVITFGDHKFEGNPYEQLSDEARAEIQRSVDQYGQEFVRDVALGRGIDASTVEASFGQGRMLRPDKALAVGMIDRVGSLDAVISGLLPAGARQRPARAARAEAPGLQLAASTGALPVSNEWRMSFGGQDVTGYVGSIVVGPTDVAAEKVEPVVPTSTSAASAAGGVSATDHGKEKRMEEQGAPRTREEIVARLEAIAARQVELDAQYSGRLMEGDDKEEFEQLESEHDSLEQIKEQMDVRAAAIERKSSRIQIEDKPGTTLGPVRSNVHTRRNLPDNLFDLSAYRGFAASIDQLPQLWAEAAQRVSDGLVYDVADDAPVKGFVSRLLTAEAASKQPVINPAESFSHRILVTANPEYDRAFGKYVMGQQLNSHEENLIKAAVSHTGLGSETPVPVTIDPTVLLTSDGTINPLRQLARVVSITGRVWRGISSDGMTVAYEAELTQVGDQTPTFDTPEAEVQKAHGYVEFSIEVDQDWSQLRAELGTMFRDAKDTKEAEKFLHGSGTNEPEGLVYTLDGSASEIFTDTPNTLALTDLYDVKGDLPARWRSNASWLANDSVYDEIRGFGDESNNTFWVDLSGDTPPRLLGKPTYEASEMGNDPAYQTDARILVYGDFRRGFVIVDRVGMNVELIPHVLGANRRPIGARALYAYFRNTSVVQTIKAFRLLSVAAT